MSCEYCGKDAIYRCNVCGKQLCMEHTKLQTVCSLCIEKTSLKYTVDKAAVDEREKIRGIVQLFWGEEEQLTFDRKFIVAELPAYTANIENDMIGFLSFKEVDDAVIIVALGVLPQYQGSGVGRRLIKKVEVEAKKKKKRLLVSTSNDDLPALAFFQSIGFQIYEVKPNVIAEKHGGILEGIGGLPVRDELRLQKILH